MRVAVVSANAWGAQGLAAFLASGTHAGDDARETEVRLHASMDALTGGAAAPPHVIVCMAANADDAERQYRDAPPGVPLVMLGEELANVSLRAHADLRPIACLAPNVGERRLQAAIDAVIEGLSVCEPGRFPEGRVAPGAALQGDGHDPLTPRELEVYELMAKGLSNRDIGTALRISAHTAKFHVSQILEKTGAATRAEAVRLGLRWGLIGI